MDIVKPKRPSWDETCMDVAKIFSCRSVCENYNVGVVLFKDKRIIATGYNGPPKGISHCTDIGCRKKDEHGKVTPGSGRCRGAHAEMNAISNAACQGVSVKGAILYCTYRPCLDCTKHIINAGIVEIVYWKDYDGDEFAFELLRDAGVIIRRMERSD